MLRLLLVLVAPPSTANSIHSLRMVCYALAFCSAILSSKRYLLISLQTKYNILRPLTATDSLEATVRGERVNMKNYPSDGPAGERDFVQQWLINGSQTHADTMFSICCELIIGHQATILLRVARMSAIVPCERSNPWSKVRWVVLQQVGLGCWNACFSLPPNW